MLIKAKKTQFIDINQYISDIPDDLRIGADGDCIIPSTQIKNLGLCIDRYWLFNDEVTGVLMYMNCLNATQSTTCKTLQPEWQWKDQKI